MGIYLRQSVSVGPFRFNLSKSGVGVSAGVKGFRVGSGPRGNYVHMGRGGVYYRHTLPAGGKGASPAPKPTHETSAVHEHQTVELHEIDSGAIEGIVDSSSEQLVAELNRKRKRGARWPWVATLAVIAIALTAYLLPPWAIAAACAAAVLLTGLTVARDEVARTTVVLYDLEGDFQARAEHLLEAFGRARDCSAHWHLEAEGQVHDSKYFGGADAVVRRSSIDLQVSSPQRVKTNVATPCVPVGNQTLYFFPDKLLIFEPNGVGAVSYANLEVEAETTKFVETGRVPRDAKVVDRTWEYVNRKGGPDRRFKDNRELPIVMYEDIHFSSRTGLNERIQLSSVGPGISLKAAIQGLS